MTAREPERHGDDLTQPEAQEEQQTAGSVSAVSVDRPEDDMRHPPGDGWPEEDIPGRFRAMAADPMAALSVAAEVLDHALTADIEERNSLAGLARAWLRLAEVSSHIQAGK